MPSIGVPAGPDNGAADGMFVAPPQQPRHNGAAAAAANGVSGPANGEAAASEPQHSGSELEDLRDGGEGLIFRNGGATGGVAVPPPSGSMALGDWEGVSAGGSMADLLDADELQNILKDGASLDYAVPDEDSWQAMLDDMSAGMPPSQDR